MATHESLSSTRSKRLVESDRGDRSLNGSPVGQGAAPRGCLVNESITTWNRRAWQGKYQGRERKGKRKKGKREEGQRKWGRERKERERERARESDGLLETLNVVWRAPVAGSTRANASLACTLLLCLSRSLASLFVCYFRLFLRRPPRAISPRRTFCYVHGFVFFFSHFRFAVGTDRSPRSHPDILPNGIDRSWRCELSAFLHSRVSFYSIYIV